MFDRACVANIMIIYYTTLVSGPNADVSYNTAWFGSWVYAEICLGIMVTCTISLPKFVEAKGEKVIKVFQAVISPLRSFSSLVTLVRSTKTRSSRFGAASDDRAADAEMHSETELVIHACGHDVESPPFPFGERYIAMSLKQ